MPLPAAVTVEAPVVPPGWEVGEQSMTGLRGTLYDVCHLPLVVFVINNSDGGRLGAGELQGRSAGRVSPACWRAFRSVAVKLLQHPEMWFVRTLTPEWGVMRDPLFAICLKYCY